MICNKVTKNLTPKKQSLLETINSNKKDDNYSIYFVSSTEKKLSVTLEKTNSPTHKQKNKDKNEKSKKSDRVKKILNKGYEKLNGNSSRSKKQSERGLKISYRLFQENIKK